MRTLVRFLRTPEGAIGATLLAFLVLVALTAPLFFPADPLSIVNRAMLRPFTDPASPLGTDRLGRDVLAQLMHT